MKCLALIWYTYDYYEFSELIAVATIGQMVNKHLLTNTIKLIKMEASYF